MIIYGHEFCRNSDMNCEHIACILIVFAQIVTCYVKSCVL